MKKSTKQLVGLGITVLVLISLNVYLMRDMESREVLEIILLSD